MIAIPKFSPFIVISRCAGKTADNCFNFPFSGLFHGVRIKNIKVISPCHDMELKKNEEYVLFLEFYKIETNVIFAQLNKWQTLSSKTIEEF